MPVYLPGILLLLLFALVAFLGWLDRRKPRRLEAMPALSFIVPCYNDGDSVGETVRSIHAVCAALQLALPGPRAELLVVDDCSPDNSAAVLEALRAEYGFSLLRNPRNLGKSLTLNQVADRARHELIVFVDADVIVNPQALRDALTRLQNPSVAAVSCPYAPQNGGFIPLMQSIEYNMLSFIQGAYNAFSAIALWGGFIVVRRSAFEAAGRFTLNAITEDMDLAFKLNERGWRVEQSFVKVRTYVPDTLKGWAKQKIRWSSGGFQCFLAHWRIWLRNPLHILFLFTFCLLTVAGVVDMAREIVLWDSILAYFNTLNQSLALSDSLRLTSLRFGLATGSDLLLRLGFTALSLPFVWPLVSGLRQAPLLLLVVPFSILYVPLFSVISLAGAFFFLQRRRVLNSAERAW